ncbi:transposase [Hymenobacter sp. DG25B]|uniref:REP-associated tyrosine transposase n=1 Tax=Hymenobacter sp. DG25B TaxID=1385664 RepID=UPI0005409DFE|nr:transposase [Hymenobacter sp. DG25B]AIZ64287.1 transposase [Hymenobacter sp. DG25B]
MSDKYQPSDPAGIYFLTMTVVDWVDLFTRGSYKTIIVDSLRYCQQHKGLVLYAWCLMPSHLRLIAAAAPGHSLSAFLRDFKKHTNRELLHGIQHEPESRREWLLHRFAFHAAQTRRVQDYKLWQDGSHAVQLLTPAFARQKLAYVHQNPVADLTVAEPEHYVYSSAAAYAGLPGLLPVELLD